MNLYQINSNYLNLLNQIEEAQGEITPEMESQLAITQTEYIAKAGSYIHIIQELNADIAKANEAIKHAQDFKKRAEEKKNY